jgi:hypothetical protein
MEIAADLVVGHNLLLTTAAGVSWRADDARPNDRPHVFARVGRSF